MNYLFDFDGTLVDSMPIYAAMMPLFEILAFWGCKALLAALLLITAFYRRGHVRELVRSAGAFTVSTVLAGGAAVAFACMLGTDLFAGAGQHCGGQHIIRDSCHQLADDIGCGRCDHDHIGSLGQGNVFYIILKISVKGIYQTTIIG